MSSFRSKQGLNHLYIWNIFTFTVNLANRNQTNFPRNMSLFAIQHGTRIRKKEKERKYPFLSFTCTTKTQIFEQQRRKIETFSSF